MARIPKPNIRAPQMETFHKHHATNAIWMALPSPVTTIYSMVIAGSVTGLAYYFGDRLGNGKGQFWMYTVMAVMTVLGITLVWLRARKIKKQAKQTESFEDAVKGSAAGWDGGSDPAEIARLDNLRKQFQKGIDAFKEYGKDFYSLPWYVMIGEPGSGKTEAIRHSDLRFPETLQDMLQGTGGTYSMDWWFTNQAVLLDTAGAMLMNPEATQRFEEFLKLLRTYRPDCPVNGIILAIPVDSLLADNPAKLEEKAKRISQQFAIIQRALDVRFPIYLMVTKSDRLPGWREFTDAAGQQTFDREMLGWSNPAELDAQFDPANIAGALDSIAGRLEGRRLALLSDPISRQAGNRRVDEVDSLFGFPETIRSLQPRLQRYLEIIFQTGTWANLPPFFRGVYFTSAMNEGAALDEQLASALGMSIETLPGGGIFNRDKSVYLRDVFTEKIFKERGLVTRLKDIGRALRRKLVWFYATTAALLALLLLLAWMIQRNVNRQLEEEQEQWRVANATWGNGAFLPIVIRQEGAAPDGGKARPSWLAAWQGENARVWKKSTGESENMSKIGFLDYLEGRTRTGLPGAGIFRIMPSIRDFERRRRVACLAVFEGSVWKPLLEGVREKLVWDASGAKAPRLESTDGKDVVQDSDRESRLAAAFEALIKIECHIHSDRKDGKWGKNDYQNVLLPMMNYLCPPDGRDKVVKEQEPEFIADKLAEIANRLYGGSVFGGEGADEFKTRQWIATNDDTPDGTLGQQAIRAALDAILGNTGVVASATLTEEKKRPIIQRRENALQMFQEEEEQLSSLSEGEATREKVAGHLEKLKSSLADLETAKKELGLTTLLKGMSRADVTSHCRQLAETLRKLPERSAPRYLTEVLTSVENFLKTDRPEDPVTGIQNPGTAKDPAPLQDPEAAAGQRLELYLKRFAAGAKISVDVPTSDLIGHLDTSTKRVQEKVKSATGAPKSKYEGLFKDEYDKVVAAIDACQSEIVLRKLFESYNTRVTNYIDPYLTFPLVSDRGKPPLTEAGFGPAVAELKHVERDMEFVDKADQSVRSCVSPGLQSKFNAIKKVLIVASVLHPDNRKQDSGNGLWLSRSALNPIKREPVNREPFRDPLNPQPLNPQPLVAPEKEDVGVLSASASQGGTLLFDGTQRGLISGKINPSEQITFILEYRPTALDPPKLAPADSMPRSPGLWCLVPLFFTQSEPKVTIKGVVYKIYSLPSFPPKWPSRQDFGLR